MQYLCRQALLYLYINDQLVINYNDSRQPCLINVDVRWSYNLHHKSI